MKVYPNSSKISLGSEKLNSFTEIWRNYAYMKHIEQTNTWVFIKELSALYVIKPTIQLNM